MRLRIIWSHFRFLLVDYPNRCSTPNYAIIFIPFRNNSLASNYKQGVKEEEVIKLNLVSSDDLANIKIIFLYNSWLKLQIFL